MCFAEKPAVVTMALGSCVAITMFSRRLGVGVICHGFLPQCRVKQPCDSSCGHEFKYVDCSIHRLAEILFACGIKLDEIDGKLFGGADLSTSGDSRSNIVTVGRQNIDVALKTMKAEGLRVVASNVEGPFGQKIFFYTHTVEVLLRDLGI